MMKSLILAALLATVLCTPSSNEGTDLAENFIDNTFRPYMKHVQQFHVGFAKSFRNIDPADPFYCVTNGKQAL